MGAGGSPCQTGRKKRRLRRPPRLAGATDRAQFGWGRGGHASKFSICAPDLRGRRGLMCDMRDYRLAIIINAYRKILASYDQVCHLRCKRRSHLSSRLLGGICLSFFLSAGELQAPCTKENEFPESVRRRKAEGFSPHRTSNSAACGYLRAAIVPGRGGRL